MAREVMVPLSVFNEMQASLLSHLEASERRSEAHQVRMASSFSSSLGELTDALHEHLEKVAGMYAEALKPPPLPDMTPRSAPLHMSETEEDALHMQKLGLIGPADVETILEEQRFMESHIEIQ